MRGARAIDTGYQVANDLVDRSRDVDRPGTLVGIGWLECLELAAKEPRRHEVTGAMLESIGEKGTIAGEVDETNLGIRVAQDIAISALERRAGDDESHPVRARVVKSGGDGFEPPLPVLIGQRDAGRHASDILRRVESVAFDEFEVQRVGESFTDHSLPRAGDTHDHVPCGPRARLVHGRNRALSSPLRSPLRSPPLQRLLLARHARRRVRRSAHGILTTLGMEWCE